MSDSKNFERLADQAALDELSRAFGAGEATGGDGAVDDDPTPVAGMTPDRSDDGGQGAVGGGPIEDLLIVEQVPYDGPRAPDAPTDPHGAPDPERHPTHPPEAAPEPGPPARIRVDDDDATGPIDPAAPTPSAPGAPPRPTIRIADDGATGPIDPAAPTPSAPGAPPRPTVRIDDDGPSDTPGGLPGAPGPAPRIISIDDADHPDAVYIKGSLDADGSHSIVIIEDDEFEDIDGVDVSSEARRGIEPRMRERRVAVKRAEGRRRLKWVLAGLGAVIVVVGTLATLGSSLFAVRADQVTVTGDVYTDPDALQAVVDELVGTATLLADTDALEQELERIPWVDRARIRIRFPRAATIEIREREAWATYQGPDRRFRVLDDEGRVLDVIDGYPIAYVLLTGPDPVDLEPGYFAPRGYAVAAELAKNLTGSVRGGVESIEVTADGSELALVLTDGVRVRFGEARDLLVKLVRLEAVFSQHPDLPAGTVDVSTREVTMPEGVADRSEGGNG